MKTRGFNLILASFFFSFCVSAEIRYVWKDSPTPAPPYTNWTTAARTIQDAIHVASAGDTVLVTNGFYDAGGGYIGHYTGMEYVFLLCRVAITKPISVLSVNGPEHTIIYGNWDARCAWVTSGALLSGFTLTNGHTVVTEYYEYPISGGGVCGVGANSVVSNCVITGCETMWEGGGAAQCSLINCKLINNSSTRGGGAINCVLKDCELKNNSALSSGGGVFGSVLENCSLIENVANYGGGGVANSSLTNCVIKNCSAYDGGGALESTLSRCVISENRGVTGGGARGSSLFNCLVVSNIATGDGGGAYGSTLVNCTVVQNVANAGGGGVYESSATNSIIYYNSATNNPNYVSLSVYSSCVFPLPEYDGNNITNEPGFVDMENGNFRLKVDSPCIDAGKNSYIQRDWKDLDGKPRLIGRNVDIGAYEFGELTSDVDGDGMPDWWEWMYGLNQNNSSDKNVDSDGDGLTNWEEYIAGTNPSDKRDVLKLEPILPSKTMPFGGFRFTARANRSYTIIQSQVINGVWETLFDVPLAPTNRVVEFPNSKSPPIWFFRVVAPQLPY